MWHDDDSASCLLPAGAPGAPVVMHHASLYLAKPKRGVTAAIGFPKMFRVPLGGHDAERFAISYHEHRDRAGSVGKMQQRSVDLRLQVRELRKILQMRRFLLDLLPQVFNRGEIRGRVPGRCG